MEVKPLGNTENSRKSVLNIHTTKTTNEILYGNCPYCQSTITYHGKLKDICIICEKHIIWE